MKPLVTLVLTMMLAACAHSPNKKVYPDYNDYKMDTQKHILRVNRHGYIIDSDFAAKPLFSRQSQRAKPVTEVNQQIENMLIEAIKLSCIKSGFSCNELTSLDSLSTDIVSKVNEVKILVYAHGGLNTYKDTDERMEEQLQPILSEESDWHYPIYISWPSNIPGTVFEHFFEIREGRDTSALAGILSSPFVLFEDLVTAIARAPANIYYQFTNDKDRFASGSSNKYLSNVWREANYQYQNHFFKNNPDSYESSGYYVNQLDNIKVNQSTYRNQGFVNGAKAAGVIAVTPIRYATGIVWNGTLAGDSWDMMKRRARAIAYPTGEVNETVRTNANKGIGQSVGFLFEELFKLENKYPDLPIKLTLVGHSMGTIVFNNLLTRYQSKFEQSKSLDSIIYMAAAANISDTLSIIPDVLKNNPKTIHFYNLTLNRVAEVAETYGFGLAPSGSLLVSIDKYHDAPEHHLLRTFGSEVNIHSSLIAITAAFKSVTDPVVLKSYNKDNDKLPFKHGHFGKLKFWQCAEWQIDAEDIAKNCK